MSLTANQRSQIIDWLNEQVPPPRLRHILSVEAWARDLAAHHDADAELAATAGLLHDLAKYFSDEHLLAIANAEPEIILDPLLCSNPHLLHGPVSAVVARQQFGITTPVILNAVRYHTLGAPAMDAIAQIVFIADALEPHRGQSESLEALRKLAHSNLAAAVVGVSDRTLRYLIDHAKLIHPRLIETRNYFLSVC